MIIKTRFVETICKKLAKILTKILIYLLSSKYANVMLITEFNSKQTENAAYDFCAICNLANLLKEKTCFKKPK